MADTLVVILGEFVQPNFSQSNIVPFKDVNSGSPFVGRPFAEDVTHVTARNDFQRSTAHPRLKKKF